MSQTIFNDIVPSTTSGNQLATYLNDFKDAVVSGFSGTSRPANLQAKGYWIDTTSDPIWSFKIWDGSNDIVAFTIDTTNNVASPVGATDLFQIAKISADTASPVLELLKERIINNGQVLSGDYVGTVQFKGNADDLSVPITVRVRGIATNNYTATTSGTDLVFEATALGTTTLAEVMRIKNNRLGIGTTSPTETLHAVGNGIRSEKASDDAVGADLISRKRRIAGTGAVQSGDVLGAVKFNSTDDASAEVLAAKVEVSATENHTTTAHGTSISVSVKKTGEVAFTEQVVIGNEITAKAPVNIPQVVDAATTGADQSITPSKSIIKVTNASLTSINNIASPVDGKVVVLMNGTGAQITLKHNAGGTAANRIMTITGADMKMSDGTSLLIAYDAGASRWKVSGPAFDSLSPMTTGGDLIYGGTSGAGTRLANGTAGQVLTSNGTTLAPSWATPGVTPVGGQIEYLGSTAPAGWLIPNGDSIGNAASGGTARANADTSTLFALLWNDHSNTQLPIQDSAGAPDSRGASAAADFAANKRMPLPNLSGLFVKSAGTQSIGGVSYSGTFGDKNQDKFQGHYHDPTNALRDGGARYPTDSGGVYAFGRSDLQGVNGPITDGSNGTPRTGTVTEPAHYVLIRIVKY